MPQSPKRPKNQIKDGDPNELNYFESSMIVSMYDSLASTCKTIRYLIVILAFTCFVMFLSIWNSMQSSWINSRVELISHAVNYFDCYQKDSIPAWHGNRNCNQETENYDRGKKYFEKYGIEKEIAITEYEYIRKLKFEKVLILNVPFLGVCIDINDSGSLGGAILCFILFMYFYSLQQKNKNIKALIYSLEKIKVNKNTLVGYWLTLNQILNLPINHEEEDQYIPIKKIKKMIGKGPNFITGLPFFVMILIIIIDFGTLAIGQTINEGMVQLNLILSIFWLILIIILVLLIFSIKEATFKFYKSKISIPLKK